MPRHADHPLAAQVLGGGVRLGGLLRMEDDLDDALAVAQVDERDPAVVATVRDPAAQRDLARRRRSARSSPHAWVRIAVASGDRSVMPIRRRRRDAPATSASGTAVCVAVVHPTQRHGAVGELLLADDRREGGVGAVGHLELRLQRTILVRRSAADPRGAELRDERAGRPRGPRSPIATT